MARAAADVHGQRVVLDVDARPDDFARLRNAAERAAAVGEVHRRLAEAFGAGPAADEVRRRRGAADLEDPDVILRRAGAVGVAPADVVQRGFDGLARGLLHAVGEQASRPAHSSTSLKCDERLALEENAFAVAAA